MPSAQHLLKLFHGFLKNFPAFSSFPSSLLLIGLEELMEINISCPCSHVFNIVLTISIFIGPFLFIFTLMFMVLRPCKYKCCPCSLNNPNDNQQITPNASPAGNDRKNAPNANENINDQQITPNASTAGNDQENAPNANENINDQQITPNASTAGKVKENAPNANENINDQQNFWKVLGHCLIPPVMWIIILLLDGDYLACGLTGWDGNYVFDKALNRSWCQPFGGGNDLQRHYYQVYISISKAMGYAVFAPFGLSIVVFVGIYDCCTSENSGCCKCSRCCKGENSRCCKGSGCCKGENSGCGCCKMFTLCTIPSTCCRRTDASTETNEGESIPLQSPVTAGTTNETVINVVV